jgi:hypothetical protein
VSQDIADIRKEYSDDCAEWNPIREEGKIDIRHAAGDPWDPKDRASREDAGRPVLSPDELSQYINQVVNDVRANKRAVKFTPNGYGATEKSADFYADKMREIEYRSKASIAYTTAFENAVQRSYGFVRVSSRYESARSVHQDLWIDPIHNPDFVTPDPYALMPDLSDMTRCWVREPWPLDQFNARWPDASLDGRGLALAMGEASDWIHSDRIFVSELWKVKTSRTKALIILPDTPPQPPGAVLGLQGGAPPAEPIVWLKGDGERPAGRVLREREVDDQQVCQYLTNGVEILEENEWPGKYIPIVGCLGKILYVDEGMGAKRRVMSLIRLARDMHMLHAYYVTCEAELVGMTPKFPYFVRRGALNPQQLLALQKSLHEPVAVIEVEPQIEGLMGQPPEFPQRQPYEPPIQALEIGKESTRRSIQSAMAMNFLPTQAQRQNEKSGVALKHIADTGQRGSYHFFDHYLDMLTQVGVVVEDLMDKVYDTARQVGVRAANEDAKTVWINHPDHPDSVSTQGHHIVTVSTGPSFDSEREAASDFADTLAGMGPEVFQLLGPLVIKLKNLGPIGDEMAELLETVQPPPVQAMRQQKKQAAKDPQAVVQELTQTKAQLQQVMQAASKMQKDLETDAAKQQATLQKAQMDGQIQIQLQEMKNAAAIEIARINAAVKGLTLDAQLVADEEAQARDAAHQTHESEQDRQHEAAMAVMTHTAQAGAQDDAHQQALEAQDAGHQQALEQGDAAAQNAMAQQQAAQEAQPEAGA